MEDDRLNRLVDSIYQCIDERKYKNAVKLCDSKKIAKSGLAQALKAHCLERLGRREEALSICRSIQQTRPTDERVLNILQLVFRMCGSINEMTESFVHATAKCPRNEDMHLSLFSCYLRQFDHLKQQTTAMRMYKSFSKPKYMYWACLSMLLQVQFSEAPVKILQLAEKMIYKVMDSDSTNAGSEAVKLLLDAMLRQGKYKEALEAFEKFTTSDVSTRLKPRSLEGEGMPEEEVELGPLQDIDRLSLRAELLESLEDWERCMDTYAELLRQYNPDDWCFLKGFISCAFRLAAQKESDEPITKAQELLHTLQQAEREKRQQHRGPFLAQLEFESSAKKENQLLDEIFRYSEMFSTKSCCFSDLKQYLTNLTGHDALLQFFQSYFDKYPIAKDDGSKPIKNIQENIKRRTFAVKCIRFLGGHEKLAMNELEKLAESFVDEYYSTLWVNATAEGGQREVQHGDDYILLAVHILMDLYDRSQASDSRYLVESAILLEHGLGQSRYNFQMRILLTYIYGALGSGEAAATHYNELGVKQIVLDSLSYLILDQHLMSGMYSEAKRICTALCQLHSSSAIEAPEMIGRAYRLGVFSKAKELTEFQTMRMARSHQLGICRGEMKNFGLVENSESLTKLQEHLESVNEIEHSSSHVHLYYHDLDEEAISKLSKNYDRTIRVEWDPPSRPIRDRVYAWGEKRDKLCYLDRTYEDHSAALWLRLRYVVPNVLRFALQNDTRACAEAVKTFETLVTDLGLVTSDDELMAQVWKSSLIGMQTYLLFVQPREEIVWAQVSASLSSWMTSIECIKAKIFKYLSVAQDGTAILSPYLLSVLSVWLFQAGHWSMLTLGILIKVDSKIKRKGGRGLSDEYLTCHESLRELHTKYLQMIQEIDSALATIETVPVQSSAVFPSTPVIPLIFSDEWTTSRKDVFTRIESSQHKVCVSFRDMLTQRVGLLKSFKW